MKPSKDILKDMYLRMKRIREFELRAMNLFAEGQIPGFVHLYLGEEAVATGVCASLRDDDYIASTHRGHGHILAKGADVKFMMAELYGKETGYCKGKGGSMHIADVSKGILGANGIVGACHNIATGAGVAINCRQSDQVSVCFFGDGSTNQGTFHESLNLASIWKLPVVYVCENNLYATGTPQSQHMVLKDVADRGAAYGIPGVVVDGNDVLAVYEAAAQAIDRARQGQGPTLLECKTYRWRGHFEGDNCFYRPEGELEEWMEKDPLPRFVEYLKKSKSLTAKEISAIDKQVDDELVAAYKFAQESAYPDVTKTVEDIYSDITEEVRVR